MPATVVLTRRGGAALNSDKPGRCVLGRASDCDTQLNKVSGDAEVSRHHGALEVDPPVARVRDLGSLNGTFVNGSLIGRRPGHLSSAESDPASLPAFPLNDGDEIRRGDAVFHVRIPLSRSAG